MLIYAKDLTFKYNQKTKFATYALNGVDISIGENEFFGVIGHTGSGKSTFIQHLNALITVQEGELFVGEYDLSLLKQDKKTPRKKVKELKSRLKDLRKTVGMVFQYPEYQLFAETVFEDVAFGVKNFNPNFSDEEIFLAVKEAIELVGLNFEEVKSKSPFDLSGGQKRRVAIAGVLAVNPQILILDEPCAGLDPAGKTELWKLLHSLKNGKVKTIIVVSHDMNDVANHCTKAAIFDGGKIKAVGTPKELFKNSQMIKECGLEVPLTAYLSEELAKIGVEIDTDFSVEDFTEKVLKAYFENQKA